MINILPLRPKGLIGAFVDLKPIYTICWTDMNVLREIVTILLSTFTTYKEDVAHTFGHYGMLDERLDLTQLSQLAFICFKF
jgi:hypothetical protein